MSATLSNIEDAFLYVSSQSYGMNEAYLSLDTGKIYYVSDIGDSDDLPDDLGESDRYVTIPHKNDLGLGRQLVDEFISTTAPQLTAEVRETFRGRGAYGRYKSLLDRHQLLEEWYNFENERELTAITDWCRDNNIETTSETET